MDISEPAFAPPRTPRALRVGPHLAALALGASLASNAHAQEPLPEAPPLAVPRLTKAPKLVSVVTAQPPMGAPRLEQSARVMLELTVQADGSVTDVLLLSGVRPDLDAAALAAVSRFIFTPPEVDGTPGAVRIRYEYVYEVSVAEQPPALDDSQPTTPTAPAQAAPPPGPVGRLEGRLLQRGTREPIIGASVSLPELGLETLTDGQGRFMFDAVSAGPVKLLLADGNHATVEDTEEVRGGQITDVTYYAEPTGFGEADVVVTGTRHEKRVVRRQITRRELTTVPGSNGDALKAVQNLPGVARTTGVARTEGDQLVLRGESNARVLLNGHPIMMPFHFDGLRSAVGNSLIESIEVTPGNYDASFGHTNSGVIDIETRRPASDGLHGYAQVDLFDATLFVEGPVSDNATFALGARRSYIDGILNLALDDEGRKGLPVAPRYYDLQGTYDWKKGAHRLRLNGFGAGDALVAILDEPVESEPALRGKVDARSRWASAQALWDYRPNQYTKLSTSIAYLNSRLSRVLGNTLSAEFWGHQVTGRSDLRHTLSPWLTARVGLNFAIENFEYDVSAPRIIEEGQPQPSLSAMTNLTVNENATTYNPAAYAAAEMQLGKTLLVVPALRIDNLSKPNTLKGATLVQPRLDARWSVTGSTTLKAGAGLYSKAPFIYQAREPFGNPQLEPERSRHYSAGVEQRLGSAVRFDAIGFYNDLYHQISAVADPAVKYDNTGKGRAYGGEFLLKYDEGSRFYGWGAYTLMRSERKDSGQEDFTLVDYDQTHNINLVGQYRLTPTWEFGARFRYVTGNPTTPVASATYNSNADIYTPNYGPVNSDRLGAFHQLDVRVDKHWLYDTWTLTAYLDVQNVYNQQNPQTVAYNFDFSQSEVSSAPNLPFLPSFGLKGEF